MDSLNCALPCPCRTLSRLLQTACQANQQVAEWGVMRVTWPGWLFAAMSFAVVVGWATMGVPAEAAGAVPVIYCTDLFHPHVDPDDHFDLATLYAMRELDIKGIVLDQGKKQLESPGRIPVSQMNRITGRNVPAVIGLADPLKSRDDKALDQAPEFQRGVEFIVQTLRASSRPVCIATLGSVRDVVAAFNREPGLFRTNVAMVLAFIGEASDAKLQEYNVGLDPQAFVGLMRSGLPVYWAPCFDGGLWQNRGHASFWRASHRALLGETAPEVRQYFIYALEKEGSDPLAFLSRPVEPERQARLFAGTRNLWCAAVLGVMSGREVVLDGGKWTSVIRGGDLSTLGPPARMGVGGRTAARPLTPSLSPSDGARGPIRAGEGRTIGAPSLSASGLPTRAADGAGQEPLFGFPEVEVSVNDAGVVSYGKGPGSHNVRRFEVRDPVHYEPGMVEATTGLLSSLGGKGAAASR